MAIPAGDIDHERENAEDLRHTVGQRAVTGEFGRYTVELFSAGYVRIHGPQESGARCERLYGISMSANDTGAVMTIDTDSETHELTAEATPENLGVGRTLADIGLMIQRGMLR